MQHRTKAIINKDTTIVPMANIIQAWSSILPEHTTVRVLSHLALPQSPSNIRRKPVGRESDNRKIKVAH